MALWIWYPGEYEFYHGRLVHMRRREGDALVPAVWQMHENYTCVFFARHISRDTPGVMRTVALGDGHVEIMGKRYRLGIEVPLPAGEYTVNVCVANMSGMVSFYADGDLESDGSWTAYFRTGKHIPADFMDCYDSPERTPDVFPFSYREVTPVSATNVNGGTLFDYGEELFARISFPTATADTPVSLGESAEEATDFLHSLVRIVIPKGREFPDAMALRYIFVPGHENADAPSVRHEYTEYAVNAEFHSSDALLDKIWQVAKRTFELNSREFFLDGIKRDRWVWSGDAYQSYFVNRYLHFDTDIAKRTIVMLGGKGEVYEHINTINDYSLYFIMSVLDYYDMTGDASFVSRMWERMKAYADFTLGRLDGDGFIDQLPGDWVFIDWAEFDFDGPLAAEQVLLWRAMNDMVKAAGMIGEDGSKYAAAADAIKEATDRMFWCEEKGAYIDSFRTGKKNVTRHANIFALLFGFADEDKREKIAAVLTGDEAEPIKTPYFKFYELSALAEIGRADMIIPELKRYFGSMVETGATTFWEQYDPALPASEQLGMYGERYGKSLCHAWGATAIYMIGRYILGVRPTAPGYKEYEVKPMLDGIDSIDAKVPVGSGYVRITKKDGIISVTEE